jgi:hypothetical protein
MMTKQQKRRARRKRWAAKTRKEIARQQRRPALGFVHADELDSKNKAELAKIGARFDLTFKSKDTKGTMIEAIKSAMRDRV